MTAREISGRYSREKDVYHIKFMGDDNSGIVAAAAFLPFIIKSFGGKVKSWFKHSKTVEKPPVSVIHQDNSNPGWRYHP